MPSSEGLLILYIQKLRFVLLIKRLDTLEYVNAIIIGSDDASKKSAEFAAKSAALLTIMNHEKHDTHF